MRHDAPARQSCVIDGWPLRSGGHTTGTPSRGTARPPRTLGSAWPVGRRSAAARCRQFSRASSRGLRRQVLTAATRVPAQDLQHSHDVQRSATRQRRKQLIERWQRPRTAGAAKQGGRVCRTCLLAKGIDGERTPRRTWNGVTLGHARTRVRFGRHPHPANRTAARTDTARHHLNHDGRPRRNGLRLRRTRLPWITIRRQRLRANPCDCAGPATSSTIGDAERNVACSRRIDTD